jgi:hypothetical protein
VVFLHPSGSWASPDTVTDNTTLLNYINDRGIINPDATGFILLAPGGRFTYHYYGTDPDYGSGLVQRDPATGRLAVNQSAYKSAELSDEIGYGWDIWYRQTHRHRIGVGHRSFGENLDAAAIDHFIAEVVAQGHVDPRRIYLAGWSNGGSMAYLYGLNRGRIAAIGVYSAANPWGGRNDPCQQTPSASAPHPEFQSPSSVLQTRSLLLPGASSRITITAPASQWSPTPLRIHNRHVPTYQIHNYCDVGSSCPNVDLMEHLLAMQQVSTADRTINHNAALTPEPSFNPDTANVSASMSCDLSCGSYTNGTFAGYPDQSMDGLSNHMNWPDGDNTDPSDPSHRWMYELFAFFAAHPLGNR